MKGIKMSYEIKLSSEIKTRHVKMMFWGPTGSRKTESILRNFPKVLLIDTEGNSDQCVGMAEIPEFLQIVTKDARDVKKIIDDAASGNIKFPDGSPVETLAIDSVSVLWGVQQEAAYTSAEQRAVKKGWKSDNPVVVQLDWVLAKRPIKMISNRMNASPIKFLILTARAKDLYENVGDDLKKVGYTPDIMKGMDYDVNLSVQMGYDDKGKWVGQVTKVQGALGKIMPVGKIFSEFPAQDILDFASTIDPKALAEKADHEIAADIVKELNKKKRTEGELVAFGAKHGLSPQEIGSALKEAGYSGFDPEKWDEMCHILTNYKTPTAV